MQIKISKATFRQILSSSMILLTSFLYGCKVGYTQSAMPIFLSSNTPFEVTANDISWIASVSYTGTLISVIICYTAGNKVSRKVFIFGCTLTFALAWLLILVTSSIYVIIGCLFFYGIAASMLTIIGHIYFSEIASPKNRETLGVAYGLTTTLGMLVEFPLSVFENYRLLAAFPLLVSSLTLVSSKFMVESPCYLIAKGFNKEAIENLCWLHDKQHADDVAGYYSDAKKYVEEQRGKKIGNLKTALQSENLKLVSVMVAINAMGVVNGSTITGQYGSVMVKNFTNTINGTWFVNINSTLGFIACLLSFVVVRISARKGLLLFGFILSTLIQISCAVCYHIEEKNNNQIAYLAVAIASLLSLLQLTFCCYVALDVLKMEVFPHKLKEFYTSLLAFTSDCAAFVVVKSYIALSDSLGIDYLLLLYAGVSLTAAAMIYWFIKDTKGKSLYEIRTDYATFY